MIDIEIEIDPYVVVAMLETIVATDRALGGKLAREVEVPDDDPDFLNAWREELRESLRADCEYLISVVQNHSFGDGVISLDEDIAEGVMRACSAVRLKLRDAVLPDLADAALETGKVDLFNLPTDQQRAYACYLFLAGLQGLILEQLDPDACEL